MGDKTKKRRDRDANTNDEDYWYYVKSIALLGKLKEQKVINET